MVEQDLTTIFNECIDRLNLGETIEQCLRRYPQYAASLRPLLETGRAVQRIRIPAVEVQKAQEHGRFRFEQALNTPARIQRQPTFSVRPFLNLAAAILFICVVLGSGTAFASQSSLPGDALYGAKLFTEQIRLTLTSNDTSLAQQFDQRRIDEIHQLIAQFRSANVTFRGEVNSITDELWLIDTLAVQVAKTLPSAGNIHIGNRVEVKAEVAGAQIRATSITRLDQNEEILPTVIPPTALPTTTPTQQPSLTPSPSATLTHLPTNTPLPTATDLPSRTPLPVSTATAVPTATQTVVASPTVCKPTPPPEWETYKIRSGDTLSGLASSTGITLEELMSVNCLTSTVVVVDQALYLPFQVAPPAPTTVTGGEPVATDDHGGQGGDDGGNSGSGSGDDHGGDNHGGSDDNSGSGKNQ